MKGKEVDSMHMPRHQLIFGVITVTALIAATAATAHASRAEAPIASEQLAGATLTVVPHVSYERALLRVVGPDGYALVKAFDGAAPITVDLLTSDATLADEWAIARKETGSEDMRIALPSGRYRYEVIFTDALGERTVHRSWFVAEGGNLLSHEARRTGREDVQVSPAAGVTGEGIQQDSPGTESLAGNDVLVIHDTDGDGSTILRLLSEGNHSWDMENISGDLEFGASAGTDMTILSDGNVGIGTTVPIQELEIRSSDGGDIRLAHDSGNDFAIQNRSNGTFLDLVATDGSVAMVIERGDGVAVCAIFCEPEADFEVFDVDDNGFAAFRLTRGSSSWAMSQTPTGVFTFNLIGSGGQEFAVRERLDAVGPTLDVRGSVRGTQFISTSSREVKTAFEAVEPREILAKVTALPVSAWRYVWEDASAHHVGPVAEDFQRLLGLGDGKTIGTVDADGVLLAAVQGLKQLVDETRAAMAAKDAEISALASEIADLQATIDSLATTPTP